MKKSETKKCRVCSSEIHIQAKKCTHCNSFQNWRRYLNFSSSILALLIALFSVSGIVIPKIQEMFDDDFSNVTAESYVITEDGISLICINTGSKAGYVSNCKIEIQNSSFKKPLWDFNLDLRLPSVSRVVGTGKLEEKYYKLNTDYFREKVKEFSKEFNSGINDENFIFYVKLTVKEYQGEEKEIIRGPSKVKDLFWNLK